MGAPPPPSTLTHSPHHHLPHDHLDHPHHPHHHHDHNDHHDSHDSHAHGHGDATGNSASSNHVPKPLLVVDAPSVKTQMPEPSLPGALINDGAVAAPNHAIDFLAGTLGGAAGVIVGHPLDTIKVRLQNQGSGDGRSRYRGTVDCLRVMIKEEKIRGLYKGMGSPIVGVAVINSLLFGVYGWFLHHLSQVPFINGANADPDTPSVSTIFWAGCFSGSINALVSCPMELVKIRLQNQQNVAPTAILKTTPHAHYHSHVPTNAPNLYPTPALSESAGNPFRPALHHPTQPSTLHPVAGLNPSRPFVTTASSASVSASQLYTGPIDCCRKIFRAEGLRGFYRGFHATLWRETPSYGAYFASYEVLSHMMTSKDQRLDVPSPGLLMAGGIAGVIAWLSTYPLDVVKTRLQSDVSGKRQGLISCFRTICRQEGVKTLFSGLGATAIRAFPTNAATFYTVTYVKQLLE